MAYKWTLEVPIFFATLGFMLTVSVNSNLLIYRTCYVLLHFNQSECAQLGFVTNNQTEYLEKLVEPTSTYISLVKTIIESVLGSALCLFIAPWSDRFGRKPVLVVGLAGGTMAMLLHVVFAALEGLSPWFLLVLAIPVIVTGGGASFSTVLSAYLTDSTTKEQRAFKMGMLEVAMALAVLLGNSSSSYLLIATNYVVVYCVATSCQLIALIYTTFLVPESLRDIETEDRVGALFSFRNFLEMIKAPFRPREGAKRPLLLLIMFTMLLGFTAGGSAQLFFYFVRAKLEWTLIQYTWYGSVTNILGIFGTIFVIYFLHTLLKIQESVLMFAGSLFTAASLIILGFAVRDWEIYLAAVLHLPDSGQGVLLRSLISKLVHEEEVAKVLSAFSIGSNILGPLSSAGFTLLYNATSSTDPGLYNFLTAAITVCSSVVFLVVVFLQLRQGHENYEVIINEPPEDTSETSKQDT